MRDDFLHIPRINRKGFKSFDSLGDNHEEGTMGEPNAGSVQPHTDGEGLRAFEVDESFVHVHAAKISPQRGP